QSSHHSCGDCSSRNESSNWNFRESDAINSPLSSTKTTLAPLVPTSNPKKYLLIYETTSLKVLRAFFHSSYSFSNSSWSCGWISSNSSGLTFFTPKASLQRNTPP